MSYMVKTLWLCEKRAIMFNRKAREEDTKFARIFFEPYKAYKVIEGFTFMFLYVLYGENFETLQLWNFVTSWQKKRYKNTITSKILTFTRLILINS